MVLPSVCVVGAGSVGGTVGALLAASGHPVSALARGRTLSALRDHGWRLRTAEGELSAPVQDVDDDPARLSAPDVLVVAVKGQALPDLAPSLEPLVGPGTTVLSMLNGVPWWFFHGIGGVAQGATVPAVDPVGAAAAILPPERTVGCVVHLSAENPEPGVARLVSGRRLIVGDAVPGSGLADPLHASLSAAGFAVEHSARIHDDVWFKLWGNLTLNPLSVLTGATMDRILDDELVAAFARAAMRETAAVGEAIGCPIEADVDERILLTRQLGATRTSMLQDAEAGRPIELDPLVTAVHQLGRHFGVPTPSVDTLLGLTRLAGRTRGLYP